MADSEGGFISISYEEVPSALLHLTSRIEVCREIVEIFRGWSSATISLKESCVVYSERSKRNVSEITAILEKLQKQESLYKEEKTRAKTLRLHCDFVINNIPDRFNRPTQLTRSVPKCGDNGEAHKIPTVPPILNKLKVKEQALPNIPQVSYLSMEEFDCVPKYMKGRLTYDKINVFIEVLNKVLFSKYAIFMKKRSTLKKKDADLWNQFSKQELRETKGMFFCVADDFQTFTGSALDKTSLNILSILRHCKRLREIRTGGIIRYVLSL